MGKAEALRAAYDALYNDLVARIRSSSLPDSEKERLAAELIVPEKDTVKVLEDAINTLNSQKGEVLQRLGSVGANDGSGGRSREDIIQEVWNVQKRLPVWVERKKRHELEKMSDTELEEWLAGRRAKKDEFDRQRRDRFEKRVEREVQARMQKCNKMIEQERTRGEELEEQLKETSERAGRLAKELRIKEGTISQLQQRVLELQQSGQQDQEILRPIGEALGAHPEPDQETYTADSVLRRAKEVVALAGRAEAAENELAQLRAHERKKGEPMAEQPSGPSDAQKVSVSLDELRTLVEDVMKVTEAKKQEASRSAEVRPASNAPDFGLGQAASRAPARRTWLMPVLWALGGLVVALAGALIWACVTIAQLSSLPPIEAASGGTQQTVTSQSLLQELETNNQANQQGGEQ